MTITIRLLGLALIGLLASACSSTTMSGSWARPDHTGKLDNVYIIGIAKNEFHRRLFEDTFNSHFSSLGTQAVSSYKDLPGNEEAEREAIIESMNANGCDSVLITKLIGTRTESVTNPGYATAYSSGPIYGGRGGYSRNARYNNWGTYYDSYRNYVVFSPPRVTEFVILTVESVLYDLKTEEMIWSAYLETVVEENIEKMFQDYVEEVTKDLEEKGLI